jgi:hypothetical protein
MSEADGYRQRAAEARAQAHQMNDAFARATLLKIAELYEKLAQKADAEHRTQR